MRPSRGGHKSRKTKELPVVEFALILWLLFIFILVVIQANHNRPARIIDAEASGEEARNDALYPAHRSSTCVPLVNLISTLQQVVLESLYRAPHNVNGTATLVHNPASLNGREAAILIG